MKKCIKYLVAISLLLTFLISVKSPTEIKAAVVNTCFPYTLGEQVDYTYTSMTVVVRVSQTLVLQLMGNMENIIMFQAD